MSPAKKTKTSMSAEHKAALAEGRSQGQVVRRYLEALEAQRPRRGRQVTPDSVRSRIAKVEEEIAAAEPLRRLRLTQQLIDLEAKLEALESTVDLSGLQKEFEAVAKGYAERKGISYAAWRKLGVPISVLKAAGIKSGS